MSDKDWVSVFDEFLPPAELDEAWNYCTKSRPRPVRGLGFHKAYRHYEGDPLQGPTHLFIHSGDTTGSAGERSGALDTNCLRDVVDQMRFDGRIASSLAREGRWDATTICCYIYPSGSGLAWHTDGSTVLIEGVRQRKIGAFILYCHPMWHSQWGGELLVAKFGDVGSKARTAARSDPYGEFDRLYTDSLDEVRDGRFYSPLPNRLVLLRPDVEHSIKKVEAAAGLAFRTSLAGFFLEVEK